MDFIGSQNPQPGFRNKLVNGTFAINQRAYASGGAIVASGYAHDRWRDITTGPNTKYTFTQSLVDTSISVSAGSIGQIVEPSNVEGGNYVLSWGGTIQMLAQYTNSGGSVTTATSNSPLQLTGVTPGTQIIVYTAGTGTLGLVQLEASAVATPFERRLIGVEFALCQRYAQVLSDQMSLAGIASAASVAQLRYNLPMPMRVVPTLSIITPGSWYVTDDYLGDYSATTFSISNANNFLATGGRIGIGGLSGLTVGRLYGGGAATFGNGRILLSSEL